MASRIFDGVYSLNEIIANGPKSILGGLTPKRAQPKVKQSVAFDPRAISDDSDGSSPENSDSDGEIDPIVLARLNGTAVLSNGSIPTKKAKRSREDEVEDSDIEREASATKSSTPKHPIAAKPDRKDSSSDTSSEGSASESTSESGSDDSESEEEVKPKAKPTKTKAVKEETSSEDSSSGSSESGSGSESESESESESGAGASSKVATKSLVNRKKPAPATSETSSADSDDSDESEDEPAKAKAASESSESEEDSSSDASTSSSDAEDSDKEMADESMVIAERQKDKKLTVPGFVSNDFVLRQAQGKEDGKDVAEFFKQAKIEGKQVWYFTAPASVPIDIVENLEIPMEGAQKGDPIFTHNGEDYGMSFDRPEARNAIQLLIPNQKGDRYESLARNVDQIMHVKRVTQMPGGTAQVTGITVTTHRTARPQPEGLKARFHPMGVSGGSMGKIGVDASSESEEDEMTPVAPPSKKSKNQEKAPAKWVEPPREIEMDLDMDLDQPSPEQLKKDRKAEKKKLKALKAQASEDESAIPPQSIIKTEAPSEKKKRKRQAEDVAPLIPKAEAAAKSKVAAKQQEVVKPLESTPAQEGKPKKRARKRRGSNESNSGEKPRIVKVEDSSPVNAHAVPAQSQSKAVATPDASKRASKRKHADDEEGDSASRQILKETASAEKKAKKLKVEETSPTLNSILPISTKKQTHVPPPTIPKPSFSFSKLGADSSPAPLASMSPQLPAVKTKKSKSKKTAATETALPSSSQTAAVRKETPIPPPFPGRSSVPVSAPPKQVSPPAALVADETPKKEKRKHKKKDKGVAVPSSSQSTLAPPTSEKKVTPILPPTIPFRR